MPFKDRMSAAKIGFARYMQRHPTSSESALWKRLEKRQLGVGFLSQECILGYIVDFYCPSARLVVEIDGSSHNSVKRRADDAQRDAAFERNGFSVLRLPADVRVDEQVGRIVRRLDRLGVARDKPAAA